MPGIDFNSKIICDNVHGSIGVSELELKIINTRTFQRLKKIKQLGLASFVFPGAEHSRFAHSIGAMHLMSQMVDKLRKEDCPHLPKDPKDSKEFESTKQKLRLAALLHDIGHYPLAHLGEQVFKWVDEGDKQRSVAEIDPDGDGHEGILQGAARKHKGDPASHERLGELILTNPDSELNVIIAGGGFDPVEIAQIFNAEHPTQKFFTQLMSSTLDCDRMDFLVRDSMAAGTSYGNVDIPYILQNLKWDPKTSRVCFKQKAVNALEHFIMARYFSYNITYHKTVMGFELMAKALFYAMITDRDWSGGPYGEIVRSIGDIEAKMTTDPEFLANFNDEYFWHYLGLWPTDDNSVEDLLKSKLLGRIPLRTSFDRRTLLERSAEPPPWYVYVQKKLVSEQAVQDALAAAGLSSDHVAVVTKTVEFEGISHSGPHSQQPGDDEVLKLIKILKDDTAKNLLDCEGTIAKPLSQYELCLVRIFVAANKDSSEYSQISSAVSQVIDSFH